VHPEDAGRVKQHLMDFKAGDEGTEEFRIVRKDGEVRWINEVSRCEAGEFPGELILYGSNQDVTTRKAAEAATRNLNEHLEQLVAERTAALERSNEDLASFSYAVSHELRAPIARLQGFTAILEETSRGGADETSFLAARIANASLQLQSVVDAILLLSRLSRMELSLQPIDLGELVKRKMALLLAENPQRQVELIVKPGVSVLADRGLMEICMDNLLGNAFKYTSQTPQARIEFGASDDSGRVVYFVRDNGAGFDMVYAEKLYTPFQRLHQHKEFPGVGIGLATVKRIIERHGGELWADGRVGAGAIFYFTLGGESR
jgi:light-regulated signal transduction histidine kinase (bacteriophytochrome)